MKVNLGYLNDILAYMIEGQYEANTLEDYRSYIRHYQDLVEAQRDSESKERFRRELKHVMKYLLNNPDLDYERIFSNVTDFGFGDQAITRQLFEMIWSAFFPSSDWQDQAYRDSNIVLVEEPYEG